MKKFRCMMEGCDCPHCRQCGRHYEPCAETARYNRCDRCIIGDASDETAELFEQLGAEEATKVIG